MVDFGKVNPEKAQEIINALKDGKINDKEMKELGLTKAEQQALNEAFSSGEVQIGDFVLVNKGKSEDGKKQYSSTKKVKQEQVPEEQGFLAKAYNKLKQDASGYIKNFRDAWNNSNGAIETASSLAGAVVKTFNDGIEDNANNIEKGVAYLTGSEEAGKFARGISPSGIADAVKDAIVDGDTSGLKNVAESFGQAAIAPLAMLTSCGELDLGDEQNQFISITINNDDSLEKALDKIAMNQQEMMKNQEATLEVLKQILLKEIENGKSIDEIKELVGDNTFLLQCLVDAMALNNQLLTDIKNDMKTGNEKILEVMLNIQDSVELVMELVAQYPDYKQEFEQIINAIKEGNTSLAEVKSQLQYVLQQLAYNGEIEQNILDKLDAINNKQMSDSEKLSEMLKLLNDIKAGIDGIAADLKEHFKNDSKVLASLDKILAEAQKNNQKAEETNALLKDLFALVEKLGTQADAMGKEILNYIAAVGFEMNGNFRKLLEAVENGNVKLDEITTLLQNLNKAVEKNGEKGEEMGNQILNYIAAVGFEMNRNFGNLIKAVNEGNAKVDDVIALIKNLNDAVVKNGEKGEAMGKEILNYIAAVGFEMNRNFGALIEAVNKGNLKADEAIEILKQLQEAVKQNGEEAKALGDQILQYIAAFGFETNANFKKVLEAIGNNGDKMNEVTDLLKQINDAVKQNGEDAKVMGDQILNYIAAFGFETNQNFKKILNAINNNDETGKGIQALLKEVLAKQDQMNETNKAGFEAVIKAIADISVTGGAADLSKIEAMLEELVKLNKDNGVKLDTITKQNDAIITILKSFQAGVEQKFNELNVKVDNSTGFLKDLNDKVGEIIDKLGNGSGNCKVDFETLMAKLQEILDAIKDHKVIVDVTGKVTCECNCGGNHEGILGDLDQILG